MISPDYEVQIWNHEGKTVKVKLVVLMTWASALKLELKGVEVSNPKVSSVVRKALSCPDSYPLLDLSEHISTSYRDIMNQLSKRQHVST